VLNRDRAAKIGVALYGELGLGTSGGSTGMSIVKGVTYAIGEARLIDQYAGAVSLAAFEAGFGLPLGGILGYDFTSRFVIELNFETNRMTLYSPAAFRDAGHGTVIPIRIEDKNAFVEGTVVLASGRTVGGLFDIDTGETKGLYLNGPFVKQNRLLEAAVDAKRKTGGQATEKDFSNSIGVKGKLAEFRFGPFRFQDPPVGLSLATENGYVANPDYAGIFGNEILGRFRLCLDLSRKQMILEPNSRYRQPFSAPRSFGLLLIAQDPDLHTFVVVRIKPGSPAEQAGFQRHDVVAAVDGRRADTFTLEELQSLFEREGEHHDVEVARDLRAVHLGADVRLVPQ
jgi:hypothetical protein